MINEFFLNRVTFLSSVSTSNELTVSDYISSGSVLYDQTGNSSNWNSVYTDVSNTSAEWDSVYTDVVNTSANWNSVYTDVSNTSAEWDSVYTDVVNTSANWNSVYSDVVNTSGNWDSVYSEFNQNSSTYTTYNYVDNNFLPASGGSVSGSFEVGSGLTSTLYVENQKVGINTETPNESLTIVGNISANGSFYADGYNNQSWDNSTTIVENTSGNWNSIYSDVVSTSGNWNSVYTDVVNTSAEWDSVYTTVNTNSSDNWDNLKSNEYTHTNFLPLSGGILNGAVRINDNLTVYGNISATGNSYFSNTVYSTTSALSVVNIGNSGPAFYVGNNGSGDIASFYDIDENIEVLHVGGNNGSHPNIGVKTSEPNKDLTINGELSASSTIWDSVGNSNQWNSVYTAVNSNSATTWNYQGTDLKNLSSGWVGGNSAFTTVNSNSANWNSIYSNVQSNFVPISGGTITGSLSVLGNITYLDTSVSVTSSMYIDTTSSEAALRITQKGSGDVIRVEDSSNPDSTPFIINTDGRVGIGTSSPISKVNIVEENENAFRISNNELHQYYASFGCILSAGYFTAGSAEARDVPLIFRTALAGAETERVRFAADGKVGINTSSPNERLTVSGNISSDGNIYADTAILTNATIQTFTNPATATGNFLILNINGSNKAIRLWDFTS